MDIQSSEGIRNLVRIAGRVVPRTMRDEDPGQWQRLLQIAQLQGDPPRCLCWRGSAEALPMSIATVGRTLVLKRLPYSGPHHHHDCDSHGGDSAKRGGGHSIPALRAMPAGGWDVKLDVPLKTLTGARDGGSAGVRSPSRDRQPGVSRQEMSLLGFLHLLWKYAGLNVWTPGQSGERAARRLGQVYAKLEEELQDLSIRGRPCAQLSFVPDTDLGELAMASKKDAIIERFGQLQTAVGPGGRPILLLIGEARAVFATRYGQGLRLKGMPDSLPIWIQAQSYAQLQRRWPAQVGAMAQLGTKEADATGRRFFVIAGVQISDSGALNWTYGAVMETTAEFIPIDSSYEARVAGALVRQERAFKKPLRYTGEDEMHPDFVLTDTEPAVTMEVFGMATPDYLSRKAEKLANYRRSGARLWVWEAHAKAPMPAFPVR